jgi:starch phosphorylase
MGAASPPPGVRIVFLPDYDMSLARLLCAGSDVWLNTPEPPNEASGTSGMKAALNGVPSVSTLDGWWLEGHIEGVTGWAIGSTSEGPQGASEHAEALYRLLGDVVIPMYYRDPDRFDAVRRNAIALNASFFSGHRMVDEYARRAYGDS